MFHSVTSTRWILLYTKDIQSGFPIFLKMQNLGMLFLKRCRDNNLREKDEYAKMMVPLDFYSLLKPDF